MTAAPNADPTGPSLADQVSRLYDLIAGYHLTHLIEFGREFGRLGDHHRPPGNRLANARG